MTDLDDEMIAALLALGDLLKRAAGDDLKSLLTGSSKLAIVPKNWRPTQPTTPSAKGAPAAKSALPSAATLRDRLVNAGTSDARRSILIDLDMTQAQARKMATDLGVKGTSRATVDQALDKVVAHFADLESVATV